MVLSLKPINIDITSLLIQRCYFFTIKDIILCHLPHSNTSNNKSLKILNFSLGPVVLVGIACTGFAFMAAAMPGPVTEIGGYFFGSCGGPLIALFIMGGAFRFVNWAVSM